MYKKILSLSIFGLVACTPEPTVVVRIDCGDHNNQDLQVALNGTNTGTCPMDMMILAGEFTVSARKDNEDASYLFAEAKMTLAENAMKRIKLDIQPIYTEEYYYRKATDSAGMQVYLEKQPDGKRRREVTDKLEQHYFDQATDIAGMKAYMEKQPDGKRHSEVTDKLEQHYFAKAIDLAGMKDYLDKQPNGKRKAEIEERLKKERAKLDNFAPGLIMVKVPKGSFIMGCSEGDTGCDDEMPRHQVNISAFALSKTEVTLAQYDAFAKATKRELPKDEGWGRGNRPVINVSWHDAVAYAKWLSEQTGQKFRLPSEAEWEYAALAGSTSRYSWGNSIDCSKASFNGGENSSCYYKTKNGSYLGTAPVASFAANAYGLHDMHGNVWEWTQDCWNDSYNNAPSTAAAWQSGNCERRMLRGGSWFSDAAYLRASNRSDVAADYRNSDSGFRVARDLPQ